MHLVVEEEEVVVTPEDVESQKRYFWNCGGDHHILQRSKTVLKVQEMNHTHVTFYDEIEFLSLISNLQLSTFTQDSNKVYF